MGRGKPLESPVQTCLDSMGISLLSEWDVFAFVYRHGASLASSDHIARLIGYESTVVRAALDRLESEKLIARSRPSQGVRFYRILASTDAGRQRCLQQIVSLSETRAGRLLLAKRLNPNGSNRDEKLLPSRPPNPVQNGRSFTIE
jgi:DNA-binding MarR family transcriptional regulator